VLVVVQLGKGWDGEEGPFFVLGLFCFLSAEEGQLAFCGGFGEISAVRLFIVGDCAIPVLLFGLLLGLFPGCVAHVTTVALVTVSPCFAKLVVGTLLWRGGPESMVGMGGSGRRSAEVHSML
jgi:hypothetical protein